MVKQTTVDRYHACVIEASKMTFWADIKQYFKREGIDWCFYKKTKELEKPYEKIKKEDVFRILTELRAEQKAIKENKRNQKITEFIKKEPVIKYDFSGTNFGSFDGERWKIEGSKPQQTITKSYFWGLFKITKTI